ncbi:hypothetical protein MAC_02073 [Metarhizium acridum CQMa 102]|uniref:Uncharacterized protein n=1 Tax=Metarhizium acridum (strain CQMa 102) TaxID=655827 RepID=E9DWS5_METAQ|nr:uncharacterized protein MAC_02073 [Metarhizium acridum CQMa 102]EFY91788.1 hypothetical protein MAC_02073 [Metarhizium acridum CQMa 102]
MLARAGDLLPKSWSCKKTLVALEVQAARQTRSLSSQPHHPQPGPPVPALPSAGRVITNSAGADWPLVSRQDDGHQQTNIYNRKHSPSAASSGAAYSLVIRRHLGHNLAGGPRIGKGTKSHHTRHLARHRHPTRLRRNVALLPAHVVRRRPAAAARRARGARAHALAGGRIPRRAGRHGREAGGAGVSHRILRASSAGALWGLGVGAAVVAGRMYGREPVEWQDRSWRLLENRGQLEMDDWTYLGMGSGVAAAWATGSLKGLGGRGVLGAVGAGGVVGGLAWAGWRFGVNGGRFKEKPKEGDL